MERENGERERMERVRKWRERENGESERMESEADRHRMRR